MLSWAQANIGGLGRVGPTVSDSNAGSCCGEEGGQRGSQLIPSAHARGLLVDEH